MRNLISALAILIIGFALSYLAATSKPKPQEADNSGDKSPLVDVINVIPSEQAIMIESQGLIEAVQQIQLTSEVTGKIIDVSPNFFSGADITANKTILRIDPTTYQANLAQAQAQLAQTEELYIQEKARARQAKKQWRNLGSDEANDLFLRKPQLATLKAQRQANQAMVASAKKALNNTNIHLDYNARIVDTNVNKGQFVSTGMALATVYANNRLQVKLPVSQKQLAQLGLSWPVNKADFPAVMLMAKLGNTKQQWPANIVQISADINSNTQQLDLIAEIDGKQYPALPGQFVQAKIFGKQQSNIYKVPLSAFHDKQYLLLLNDQKITFVSAVYLAKDDDHILLQAKLPKDAQIVTSSLPLAFDGMTVKTHKSQD